MLMDFDMIGQRGMDSGFFTGGSVMDYGLEFRPEGTVLI